jgi:dTDP-4-dehydrorhamnose 3,5-epimerase
MKFVETGLPGVLIVEPRVFTDDRGFFLETYHRERFHEAGITDDFVQDNHSFSSQRTLRGLHFQEPNAQGKLVRCAEGVIVDVAVDIRRGSPHFGRSVSVELSGENKRQLWVPAGFAHGFSVVSETAHVIYKCTALYDAKSEHSILWNDPDLGIDWKVTEPKLSPKDAAAPRLRDAVVLPAFAG